MVSSTKILSLTNKIWDLLGLVLSREYHSLHEFGSADLLLKRVPFK